MTDHDQRFKILLKEFFPEFFQLFFPEWAPRFDFAGVEWLDKEVFTDPPQGERRYLDLVARVPVNQALQLPRTEKAESWLTLIHVEIEQEDKVAPLRPRMFAYYEQLRRLYESPVLPIGLYLRVGLDGIGWDVYEEYFWEQRLLRFEYAYIGLPALNAEEHISSANLLSLALSALMRIPEARKAELKAEALQRLNESKENNYRRHLVLDCIEAYLSLDDAQKKEFDQLLINEKFKGAREMMMTTFEKGLAQGMEQGLAQGSRKMLQIQLEERFGPLSEQVLQRLAAYTLEQLNDLARALLTAPSLKQLGLED